VVADQGKKSPAPEPKSPGRVEESLSVPDAAAGTTENPRSVEVAERLQQNVPAGPTAAASILKVVNLIFPSMMCLIQRWSCF
jgi:hypothetical protein